MEKACLLCVVLIGRTEKADALKSDTVSCDYYVGRGGSAPAAGGASSIFIPHYLKRSTDPNIHAYYSGTECEKQYNDPLSPPGPYKRRELRQTLPHTQFSP